MEPVRAGLGDRLAAEFVETTSAKRFETAVAGAERFADCGADALVAVSGGSSLDVAKIMAALSAAHDTSEAARDTFEDTGAVITSRRDGLVRGCAYDEQLMPAALHYDPDLVRPAVGITSPAVSLIVATCSIVPVSAMAVRRTSPWRSFVSNRIINETGFLPNRFDGECRLTRSYACPLWGRAETPPRRLRTRCLST